jgi:integrase
MLARRAKTPGAANDLLKKIRILIGFAIANGIRRDDPTLKMKKFKAGEFHTWTEDEIAQFEKRWPVGSTQRLAFAMLLFTGQRVSDVAAMEATDISAEGICVTQIKTKAKLVIPTHPELATVLAISAAGEGALIRTSFGNGFTQKGLANFMAEAIDKAALPGRCVTHGIRKAAARRLAEAGCSVHEIMAVTGHRTLAEVERYTRGTEQKRLARSGMGRLSIVVPQGEFPNPHGGSRTRLFRLKS